MRSTLFFFFFFNDRRYSDQFMSISTNSTWPWNFGLEGNRTGHWRTNRIEAQSEWGEHKNKKCLNCKVDFWRHTLLLSEVHSPRLAIGEFLSFLKLIYFVLSVGLQNIKNIGLTHFWNSRLRTKSFKICVHHKPSLEIVQCSTN